MLKYEYSMVNSRAGKSRRQSKEEKNSYTTICAQIHCRGRKKSESKRVPVESDCTLCTGLCNGIYMLVLALAGDDDTRNAIIMLLLFFFTSHINTNGFTLLIIPHIELILQLLSVAFRLCFFLFSFFFILHSCYYCCCMRLLLPVSFASSFVYQLSISCWRHCENVICLNVLYCY